MAIKKNSGIEPEKKQYRGQVLEFLKKRPHVLSLSLLAILLMIFYQETLFSNKTFLPPDTMAARSNQVFYQESLEKGQLPLWNPYIFSGMPSFASLQMVSAADIFGTALNLIIVPLEKVMPNSDFVRAFVNYFVMGLFCYLLVLFRTKKLGVALFAAVCLVFQPNIVAFIAFGHGSKLTTCVMIPIIYLLLDEFLDKKQIRYFALLALAVGLQLLRAHTQMAYYTFMMIGLYLVFWLIYSRTRKCQWGEIFKSMTLTGLAIALGIALSAVLYLSVFEYAEYSIRGGTGLDYGYATNWSFSPKELITFLTPSFYGFGGQTYWGKMPFTDFPLYMGIVPLLFASMAVVLKRDKNVTFFLIMGGLAILVSFGKHFPLFYDLLFNVLPFFNKFRVPSMILILLQFSVVMLSAIGLNELLQLKDKSAIRKQVLPKFLYSFVGIVFVVMLFLMVSKGSYLQWVASSGKNLSAVAQSTAYDMAASDAVRIFFLTLATAVLIFLWNKQKVSRALLLTGVIVLTLTDLWTVDNKIINPQPKGNRGRYFADTDASTFLKEQTGQFRIFQAYDDKSANWYTHHKLQNIQGYHTARLKSYQTFMEKTGFDPLVRNRYGFPMFMDKYYRVVMGANGQASLQLKDVSEAGLAKFKSDNAVLDMLNVKYLISHYPVPDPRYKLAHEGKPAIFENTNVLPRAFWVDTVRVVDNEDEFYRYLASGNFNPAKEAILFEKPDGNIQNAAVNRVEVTAYDIHEITLQAEVEKAGMLVLSEIYYPAGWKAYIDGQETKIYQANGILRAIFVEPGARQIRFEFKPKAFRLGFLLTTTIIVLLLGLLIYDLKFRKKTTLDTGLAVD